MHNNDSPARPCAAALVAMERTGEVPALIYGVRDALHPQYATPRRSTASLNSTDLARSILTFFGHACPASRAIGTDDKVDSLVAIIGKWRESEVPGGEADIRSAAPTDLVTRESAIKAMEFLGSGNQFGRWVEACNMLSSAIASQPVAALPAPTAQQMADAGFHRRPSRIAPEDHQYALPAEQVPTEQAELPEPCQSVYPLGWIRYTADQMHTFRAEGIAADRAAHLMEWEKCVDLAMAADWQQRAIKAEAALAARQAPASVPRLDYDLLKLALEQTQERLRQADEAIAQRDATALRGATCAGEFARDAARQVVAPARPVVDGAVERDAAILNWLETKSVNVRDPLRYGSRDMFWASAEDDDGDTKPSSLRSQCLAAIAQEKAS